MNRFLYNLYNILLNIIEKASVLLIVGVLSLIIFSRLDNLFQSDIVTLNPISVNEENDLLVQNDGAAPIVYKGSLTNDDTTSNVTRIDKEDTRDIPTITFEITDEDNIDTILNKFVELGFIEDKGTFKSLLNDLGVAGYINPGVYEVPENIKNLDLAETITIGVKEE